MLLCPSYHPRWRVTLVPDEGVYFVSEHEHVVFEDAKVVAIARLIDGRRSSDVIASRLRKHIDPAETYYLLSALEEQGYVSEPTAKQRRRGSVGDTALVKHLAVGARVVVVDDYLSPELDGINRASLRSGEPWMLARATGEAIWAGPVFVPGQTACWSCLAYRLSLARPVDAYLAARREISTVIARPAPVSASTIARMADRVRCDSALSALGIVITFDVARDVLERHPVEARPQCPVCGDRGLYARELVRLDRAPDRQPDDVVSARSSLVSPIAGITASISKISTVEHALFHVYAAAPVCLPVNSNLSSLRASLRYRSAGSGTTDSEAIVAALSETVERLCGTAHGDEPRLRASFDQLGRRAIHPNECMLFSDAQFRMGSARSVGRDPMHHVPRQFDTGAIIHWTPVWSLTSNEQRLLPTAYLYLNAWRVLGAKTCASDTNGNAAGATRVDAILSGLFELVERDSIALWWYNRIPRPALDLVALRDSYCLDLSDAYRSLGREYWVLDITSDLGIPVFAAVTRRVDSPREEIIFGFGAHLDARRAIKHAVTEMNQMVASLATMCEDEEGLPSTHARWMREATLENQSYLCPSGGAATPPAPLRPIVRRDPRADLACCRDLIEQHEMELLVLDLTRPDVGMPVVKVIVPGLRPAVPRFGPGRLFDTPVRLGWLAGPTAEAALNPFPFFL